jgi:putative acetyltransferase
VVTPIIIREANADDAATIAAIHEAAVLGERGRSPYSVEQLEAWARRSPTARLSSQASRRRFFLVIEAGVPLAYAQLDLERGVLRSLYVRPQQQRRGRGRRLADHLLSEARSAGLARLELDASLNSVAFYETLGFSCLGAASHPLADGAVLPCERMGRDLA